MFDGADSPNQSAVLNAEKLAKVLALADSEQEGEALAAVRKAGGMLAKAGLSFADLLAAPGAKGARPDDADWVRSVALLVIGRLRDEVAAHRRSAKDLQRRLNRAQRDLRRARRDAAKWKDAAELTGGPLAPMPTTADAVAHRRTRAAIRAAIAEYLTDPVKTALPDREIARRVGVSNQTVANHRKRFIAQPAA